MAKKEKKISKREISKVNENNKNISGNINGLFDKLQTSLFGSLDKSADINHIQSEFDSVLNDELNIMKDKGTNDITSFITKLVSNSEKNSMEFTTQIEEFLSGSGNSSLDEDLKAAYENNLIKREDIHEVTSKLIELRDAVRITRDAIVTSDVTDGRLSRTLLFENVNSEDSAKYISIVEKLEEKLELQKKIKNYIVPNTLEQGEYYAYVVPYSKLFQDFDTFKKEKINTSKIFSESVLEHNVDLSHSRKSISKEKASYGESLINKLSADERSHFTYSELTTIGKKLPGILENITIINESVHIPYLESGIDGMEKIFYEHGFMTEDGKDNNSTKIEKVSRSKNRFSELNNIDDGIIKDSNNNFVEIQDCYTKLYPSKNLIPAKIMNNTIIGYCYVCDDGPSNAENDIALTIYDSRYNRTSKTEILSKLLAEEIIKSFDKKFLIDNIEFKELIVEAINFYNLSERKIRFQFIPAEYIVRFSVNDDEDGVGHSIVEQSLFYAKLFLVLLLFKLMSIIEYSNDTRVHYIRTSNIENNIINKIQEITRKMQSRKVNILDMFSYTTLVNKIGSGADRYIPIGRKSDVRGIETEVLSGQDVQLNTELMEMLKTAYISATGCPAVIMNYINEADFAKSLELGNARFVDNVVSYKLDFNTALTELYKKLMRYATNIPEDVINKFKFVFAQPKAESANVTVDMLDVFERLYTALVPVAFGQNISENPTDYDEELRLFRLKLMKRQLPMINVDEILKFADEARVEAVENKLKAKLSPNPNPDESGDGGY